ncbi:DNA polymerase III subunit gamma/tau [Emcibacter nanhaiensis]|uniref:DNA polymerase III subunit gamma/tau n=1 Tax=Emcibacter nanhaiensis TaxID=1505037 RepID=A0A501PCA8_9PROT|nr:DNA polymerase III subunit gamma/tau [Emcibacter nanhaiensis]TPD57828.1 DNA polymerase III subunit gamma/tau [Emcibacter nanhaiensis]
MAETDSNTEYRVLARKYRPTNFDELIGQEAMVRTLSNAIETGRLAHAFILTGVRGVGKTTTARIIAKALNCTGPDGTGGPTINPCGVCENCKAIAESRHVDVMEMDAASRTGVDDIREIIEGVRYASTNARYKIYIIDEVHMLSRNAFNALLKTLEEPPEHVKFIFATTEIRKVPVTVLSRCQRFDLRRVSIEELSGHFRRIAEKEGCEIDDNALAMISRAAEGSVRDGLSLLDQAFAHGAGKVTEEQVRDMLGLADRAQVLDLYQACMKGDSAEALRLLRHQYDHGADPVVIFQDMLELTHWLTRLKVVPDAGEEVVTSEAERSQGKDMASSLSIPVLTRAWQMLLKGLEEVRIAPSPLLAAEMVLVRLTHVANLPTPGELVKKLQDTPASAGSAPAAPAGNGQGGNGSGATAQSNSHVQGGVPGGAPQAFRVIQGATGQSSLLAADPMPAQETSLPSPETFEDVVKLFEEQHEATLAFHLKENCHLVSFSRGRLDIRLNDKAPRDLIGKASEKLREYTGQRWVVSLSSEQGDKSLYEKELHEAEKLQARLTDNPLVRAVLETFPGAKISDIRRKMDEFAADSLTAGIEGSGDFMVGADEFGLDADDF